MAYNPRWCKGHPSALPAITAGEAGARVTQATFQQSLLGRQCVAHGRPWVARGLLLGKLVGWAFICDDGLGWPCH